MRTIPLLLGLLTAAPIPPATKTPPVTCAISRCPTVELGQVPVISLALTNHTRSEMLLAVILDA